MSYNVAPALATATVLSPIVGSRVELQLLTTLKCNLKCTYCSLGVGEVLGSQTELKYDIDQLARFIDTQLAGKEIYVTFYGGEPTLNVGMMKDVMQRFPEFRYQLQTNGTLLDNLPDWMLARFSNVLVSIDGGEEITDGYRGRGIWRQVIRNLNHVHERVGGTITARITWGNPDTSFEELDELATAVEAFDYLYWQFVADEMYAGDSIDRRKAVLVKLIDKFFSAHRHPLSAHPADGYRAQQGAAEPGAGTLCRHDPVPRLDASHQCHAQRRDLSLPGHDVRRRNEDGRDPGQLAEEEPAATDAGHALRSLRGLLLVPAQLHEEPASGLRAERRALPEECRRTDLRARFASSAARSTATTRSAGSRN